MNGLAGNVVVDCVYGPNRREHELNETAWSDVGADHHHCLH